MSRTLSMMDWLMCSIFFRNSKPFVQFVIPAAPKSSRQNIEAFRRLAVTYNYENLSSNKITTIAIN